MSFERFIALRYLRSKQQTLFINIIMLVSVVGITVGVAALLIVLSVFNGFNKVVTDVLVGFDPHLRMIPARGRDLQISDTLREVLNGEKELRAWSPYIESKAMLSVRNMNRVVVVRGVVDSTIGLVTGVRDALVLGTFDLSRGGGRPGIVLGLTLADRLGATVGTDVSVLSPVGADAALLQYGQPLMQVFTVVGIYDSRNKEYDSYYAFISLDDARKLFQYPESVSGIEMRVGDIQQSEQLQQRLQHRLGESVQVLTWYDLHKDLYSVMKIERWGAYIILCLIVGVATFNMLGSLTMGVIEKRRDIGVLKALGATSRSVLRVFMFEGVFVGAIGTLLGMGIGLLVCYLQITYQLFPLDPNVYIIPAIPVDVRWSDFAAIGSASMALSSLAALYPARRAASLMPVEAIRWE
ncbi:MAG TPA: ABC transporter permease [Bacteroidota bacterium]|nr:ABC transporter permease [Bacteroidota bacterium]